MTRPVIRVRGRSFIALALTPDPPVVAWLHELDQQMARASGYFAGKPVVLDLANVPLHGPGLRALLGELRQRDIHVLGLENVDPAALGDQAGYLPPLLTGGRASGPEDILNAPPAQVPSPPPKPSAPPEPSALLLKESLRSGQSIHFMTGDVTVIGAVASGAEIIASGSIHVYGALRGRALAGISGDTGARIFCQRLDAEMLAIAGAYVTADHIGPELRGRRIQAWFDGAGISLAAME